MSQLNTQLLPDLNSRGVEIRTTDIACRFGPHGWQCERLFSQQMHALRPLVTSSQHLIAQACSQILEEHHRAFGHTLQPGRKTPPKNGPLSPANRNSVSVR